MIRESGSLRKKGEKRATHKGIVLTRTTELATVVYSREVIHVAKCKARKIPDRAANPSSRRLRPRISDRRRVRANGDRIRVASDSRQAAMTREGAYSCAYRINMEAVETARIPMAITSSGATGGWRCWDSMYLPPWFSDVQDHFSGHIFFLDRAELPAIDAVLLGADYVDFISAG